MNARWIGTIILVILLTTIPTDAQKRRKGDKKKESEAVTVPPKSEAKPEGKQRGRHTTTTTTTTTQATTTVAIVEEDVDEEIIIVNQPRSIGNVCPPELKAQEGKILPCTCRDELDENALMVECVALTSAQQMHTIFNVIFSNSPTYHKRNSKCNLIYDRLCYSEKGSMHLKFAILLWDR